MKKNLNKVSNKKGSALLIAMALIAMLTGVAIMSVDRSNIDMEMSYNQLHEEQTFYAAEAGAARALVELNNDYNWRGPILDAQLDGRTYAVIVLDSLWDPALKDTILIKATANYQNTAVNLENWVAPKYYQPFQWAAFGKDSIIMRNTACTDSYNSDSGTYAQTYLSDEGGVRSNGPIKLTNSAIINGGAETSLPGGISTDNTSQVDGTTNTLVEDVVTDFVTDSIYAEAEANNNAPAGFSGGYSYNPTTNALALNTSETLVLSSGVYYFSSVTLGQQSSIKLAPGAEVTIYMTGNMSLGQGSAVNPGGSPADFIIYSQGTELNINQGTTFNAAFWGPNANIKVEQNTTVYGSLAGASVRVVQSACIHFDRSLLEYYSDQIESMEMVAWRQN